MLIDTHAHLYATQFDEDLDEVIARAHEAGVKKVLLPNIDETSMDGMHALCSQHPNFFYPMMGLHPCSVKEDYKKVLALTEDLLFNNKPFKYIAVGEIGIDLYWDKTFQSEQEDAFRTQIKWAKELELPIVIHARESFPEIFKIVDELNDDRLTGVFHCFTGNREDADHIIEYGGFKLGIGGVLTFKNAGLDKVVANIAPEHLILETDSPYLAPHPHRGKRNESSYIKLVAEKLSEVLDVDMSVVADITTKNALELFRL